LPFPITARTFDPPVTFLLTRPIIFAMAATLWRSVSNAHRSLRESGRRMAKLSGPESSLRYSPEFASPGRSMSGAIPIWGTCSESREHWMERTSNFESASVQKRRPSTHSELAIRSTEWESELETRSSKSLIFTKPVSSPFCEVAADWIAVRRGTGWRRRCQSIGSADTGA
jgi:hypothetical protein